MKKKKRPARRKPRKAKKTAVVKHARSAARVSINAARCKGCYLCLVNCQNGLLRIAQDLNVRGIRPVLFAGGPCTGCTMCAIICPEGIITITK